MRALIVSDIHGNYSNMKKVIDDNPSFDYLLILGDILGYSNEELIDLLNSYNTKIIAVRGNCDVDNSKLDFSMDNYYIFTSIDNKIFYLTHGHMYDISSFKDIDYDVYIQGHTHISMMEKIGDRLFLNPGSVSLPRGGSMKSYILYEDGIFYLKSVDTNEIIKKVEF